VRNVEPADRRADSPMFLQDGPILEWHIPPSKIDEASTQLGVEIVKG
jgi:hypothetical protein